MSAERYLERIDWSLSGYFLVILYFSSPGRYLGRVGFVPAGRYFGRVGFVPARRYFGRVDLYSLDLGGVHLCHLENIRDELYFVSWKVFGKSWMLFGFVSDGSHLGRGGFVLSTQGL